MESCLDDEINRQKEGGCGPINDTQAPLPHLRSGGDTRDKGAASASQTKPSPKTTGWKINMEPNKLIVKRWRLKRIAKFT